MVTMPCFHRRDAQDTGSNPGWRTEITHAMQCSQKRTNYLKRKKCFASVLLIDLVGFVDFSFYRYLIQNRFLGGKEFQRMWKSSHFPPILQGLSTKSVTAFLPNVSRLIFVFMYNWHYLSLILRRTEGTNVPDTNFPF